MIIFDALRKPSQIDLLQEALQIKNNSKKRTCEDNIIISNIDDVPRAPIGIRRSPPFYMSLRLECWVVNNYMIDIREVSIAIPKAIIEEMKLYIIKYVDGIIHLDSSPMDVIGNVKSIPITLNMYPNISFNRDIIVVDLPPLFEICISREFTTKLGGYLALDYTHLMLPYKDKYVKIPNEGTKAIHLRSIFEQNCMITPKMLETFDQDAFMESLLTIKIISVNELNYQFTKADMGNYYLHENTYPISVITNKELKVWIIFFDGARCKHGYGASVVFKSPTQQMKKIYF